MAIVGVETSLTRDEAARVVASTAYAEATEDAAAAALKELTPEAVAGVWPEFALLNHSCAPAAVAVPFGAALVVRAAAPIAAGEEVTVSYLGGARLAPVRARRAALRAGYGFHCQCARCLAEQRAFPTNWYPQDAPLLGLAEGGDDKQQQTGGDSGSSSSSGGSLVGRAWRATLDWFGVGPGARAQPAPSADNFALQQLWEEAAPGGALEAAVQAAAAAPARRTAAQRRAAVVARAAAGRARLEAAIERLPRAPAPAERRWLLASAFPFLRLEADALGLFLSGGALPSAADIARAERAAAGGRRGARERLAGWLGFGGGGGAGDADGASTDAPPQADDERAEAAARRALRARQLVALSAAVEALDGAARGSDLHLRYAVAALDAARALHATGSVELRAAELACSRAHAARYGPLAPGLLRAAVGARRRQLLGASLARRMDLLAWDAAADG